MAMATKIDVQQDERRFDLRTTMQRQMRMGGPPNPLIAHFKNDRVLMNLEINYSEKFDKEKYQACAPFAALFVLPCFWPHLLMISAGCCACGTPCDYCFCAEERQKKIGDAHKLILRENSILYKVDRHSQSPICQPICCNLCEQGTIIDGWEEVYPLSMVTWIGVVPAIKLACGQQAGPDTLVVKINNQNQPSVSIDAPKNAEAFIDALNRQKGQISDRTMGNPGADLPPQVLQEFNQYLASSNPMGGLMGAMMMGTANPELVQMQAMQTMAMLQGGAGAAPGMQNMGRPGGYPMDATSHAPVAAPVAVAVAVSEEGVAPKLQGYSVADVVASLTSMGLSQYAPRFQAEGINGAALGDLSESVLENDLGVGSGLHRKKIMRWVHTGSA